MCFLEVQAPEDWIRLEITRFSGNGRSAFVRPVAGDMKTLHDTINKAWTDWEEEHARQRARQEAERAAALGIKVTPVAVSPAKPARPYLCQSCAPKSKSTGPGKCVVCRGEYV